MRGLARTAAQWERVAVSGTHFPSPLRCEGVYALPMLILAEVLRTVPLRGGGVHFSGEVGLFEVGDHYFFLALTG